MDPLMRRLIKLRLEDGRLPRGPVAEVLDGTGNGQPCDAAETSWRRTRRRSALTRNRAP